MNPVDSLKSVLCEQDGKCCIAGSEADRKVVDEALAALDTAQPVQVNALLVGLLEPAFTEIQHVLGSTLELPFQRKSLETALELLHTALTAAQQGQPDCRTCGHFHHTGCVVTAIHEEGCTNGDKYQEASKVVLWSTES